MAAAAVVPPTVNLNAQNNIPIRLGTSILKPTESKRFASVRYNHKPRLESSNDSGCSINALESNVPNSLELTLQDGGKHYTYFGRNVGDGDSYVLLVKKNGKDMEMVLEKLHECHDFNLLSSQEGKSVKRLAERYYSIPFENEQERDLFGEDVDYAVGDEPRDPENPFDYRNYLKQDDSRAKATAVKPSTNGAGTALSQERPASTTPHSRPSKRVDDPLLAQRKRKVQDTTTSNPKRVKAGTEPPQKSAPASATPKQKDVPKLRMDRKATLPVAPPDDSGELVIDNETPVQEKPRGAMALALSGQLGQGPISLHSAASSPASRVASPAPSRREEGQEFEIGDDDADADADVEDLELPSPAQAHHTSKERTGQVVEEKPGADDEDDLDKQLALAMAEEDEPPAAPVEEDEESEEE